MKPSQDFILGLSTTNTMEIFPLDELENVTAQGPHALVHLRPHPAEGLRQVVLQESPLAFLWRLAHLQEALWHLNLDGINRHVAPGGGTGKASSGSS